MISYVIIGIQVLSNVMVTDVVLLAHKCLGKAEENKKTELISRNWHYAKLIGVSCMPLPM